MAFVARRNSEGEVVDRQVLSGRRQLMSDEDTDEETLHGYSNRTYGAPTVRHIDAEPLKSGCETDAETTFSFESSTVSCGGSSLDSDLESVMAYTSLYAAAGDSDLESIGEASVDGSETDAENSDARIEDEQSSLAAVAVEEEHDDSQTMLKHGDVQSLASFESVTVCQPVQTDRSSLGNVSSRTYFQREATVEDKLRLDVNVEQESNFSHRTFILDKNTMRDVGSLPEVEHMGKREEYSSADSTCSWSDMYANVLKVSESRSNIVPSLSLDISAAGSSGSSTYYRSLVDDNAERQGQGAYEDWLSRKEQQKQLKAQQAKVEREEREAQAALRQRLAQERYEAWCKQKERERKSAPQTATTPPAKGQPSKESSPNNGGKPAQDAVAAVQTQRRECDAAARQRIQEWKRRKAEKEQRERDHCVKQQENRKQLEQARKQESDGAWHNWMKQVQKRPKPVPLNQGLDTLRGTVSNIYINPIPWVSNITPGDSRGV